MDTGFELGAAKLQVERSYPVAAEAEDLMLHWPSGSGEEVGIARATIEEAWQSILHNHDAAGRDLVMHEVHEDGAAALILEGLAESPVTLVEEPELASGCLAICADRTADVEEVSRAVRQLLPDLDITFYEAPAADGRSAPSSGA